MIACITYNIYNTYGTHKIQYGTSNQKLQNPIPCCPLYINIYLQHIHVHHSILQSLVLIDQDQSNKQEIVILP